MPKLVILGSSSAVPDPDHENTYMAIIGGEQSLLIDCAGSPILRLEKAGVILDQIADLILTHFHPDHVSGVASLLMDTWLMGRKTPIDIHGLAYTIDRMEKLMEYYDWATWPNLYPVNFHALPAQEMVPVLERYEYRVFASLVHHLIPTIGLRIEFPASGKVLAYSCDTEPCAEVIRLASEADVLIHEVAGATIGHTSAAMAGKVATEAKAKSLYLIHYPTRGFNYQGLVDEARTYFAGPVTLAVDFMELEF